MEVEWTPMKLGHAFGVTATVNVSEIFELRMIMCMYISELPSIWRLEA